MSRSLASALRLAPLVFALYFYGLSTAGLLSADEPRYAAVAREMWIRRDWVTPYLWGSPWFEKPPLLYWIQIPGLALGLSPEIAARLPVALSGVAFLAFYYWWLRREFNPDGALLSTAILGTCAGWVAFSHAGVTDIPLAVCFGAAMLIAVRSWGSPDSARPPLTRTEALVAGILFGGAMLAKGLVPLVLAAPLARLARREWKALLWICAGAVVIALPWYALCGMRNGGVFWDEFIWKHHFQRFSSEALAHVQPWWFYLPVLLGGLFPWTPLTITLADWNFFLDRRMRYLAVTVIWGFVFFSAAQNKLPGYLLPLLPSACALLGLRLAQLREARWLLVVCALLLVAIPLLAGMLPTAMTSGLSRATIPPFPWRAAIPVVAVAAFAWYMERVGQRAVAVGGIAVGVAAGVVLMVLVALPRVDHQASARFLYLQVKPRIDEVCYENVNRSWEYGLNFYAGRKLPRCEERDQPIHIYNFYGRALPTLHPKAGSEAPAPPPNSMGVFRTQ